MHDDRPARLAEVLGALSLATDAVDGFPYEKALRTAVLTQRVAQAMDLPEWTRCDAYYGSVVRYIGCTAFAPEETAMGSGDDNGLRWVMAVVDDGQPEDAVRRISEGIAAHEPPARRARAVAEFLSDRNAPRRHHIAACDAGVHLGRLLGMAEGVVQVLEHAFERYDGTGMPAGIGGDQLGLSTRLVQVCDIGELFHHRYGMARMAEELDRRAGQQLDPTIVEAALALGPGLVAGLGASCWDEYLDLEPGPPARVSGAGLDRAALAFARFVDLKSTWTLGHSERVAELAGRAGEAAGLTHERCRLLRWAGLLHDLGRSAVPNGIWDKPGPLNAMEWERVRTHAYHTERILGTAPLFAELTVLAGAVHERPAGGGYHKGLPGSLLTQEARLLAAADACAALGEGRAHRPARSLAEAAGVLSGEASSGRFDLAAVRCVLEAAGAATPARTSSWPAGLTDREVDVLRLLAAGAANKDIAKALGIAPKTVGHHVGHIYDKAGCRSRAGAALFAVEHGIVGGRS